MSPSMMILSIEVVDPFIASLYKKAAEKHNANLESHPDAGFDLFVPEEYRMTTGSTFFVDFKIKCSATINGEPTSYYLYPRSRITKTPLRLANSVGIIDSGYRGHIMAAFDCRDACKVNKCDRLVQICAPNLCPIKVVIVEGLNDQTRRGIGGFGSTGD